MKMKYIPKRNIESITIVDPSNKDKTIVIPASETVSGEHKFEKGGKLSQFHTYIPRRNVKHITLKDGAIEKDFLNGFWVKKQALESSKSDASDIKLKDLISLNVAIQTGSSTIRNMDGWNNDDLIKQIRLTIKHYLFDSDFYFNWTDNKDEYLDVFNSEVLFPMMKDIDKTLNEFFDLKDNTLSFVEQKGWIDNWFINNKSISQKLKNDYYKYRKEYAGVNLNEQNQKEKSDKNNTRSKKEFDANPFARDVIELLKESLRLYIGSKKSSYFAHQLHVAMFGSSSQIAVSFDAENDIDSGIMDLLIECYQSVPFSYKNKLVMRPLQILNPRADHYLTDDAIGIDYDDSQKIFNLVNKKYFFKDLSVKKVAFSRKTPISEQPAVLKVLDEFTIDDPLRTKMMRVGIETKNDITTATAVDGNVLMSLVVAKEDDKNLAINPKAIKQTYDNYDKLPDWRGIMDWKISDKDFGTYQMSKEDVKKLIDHCNAVIDYGLTSSNPSVMILRMPHGKFFGFNPKILLTCIKGIFSVGHESLMMVYDKKNNQKYISFLPADTDKNTKFYENDIAICMPIYITESEFNYFYYDIKLAKVIVTPKDYAEIMYSDVKRFAKGGTLFGDDDSDLDMEDVYAKGGDVPVSDPLEHDQLYTIYNVKTGTDKHSAIVAQEVIDIVKTDAGPDADINTLAEAKVYLEQNGYLLDEIEVEFALGGGLADNISVDDIARLHEVSKDVILNQLKKGIQVEMEHTNNKMIAREIAMDHLVESPVYYTLLEDMEQKFAKGGQTKGKRIGFKALAEKVSKAYEGKPVPSRYKSLYGKTYSKKEADLVGQKVAAKVYRNQSK